MQLDWRIRLALVIGGALVIAVALAGAAWGALDDGLVQQVITIGGGLLAGLGLAGGPSRGAGAALLLIALAGSTGCAAAQRPQICDTTTAVVNGLGAGLSAAEALEAGRGGEAFDEAMLYAQGSQAIGSLLAQGSQAIGSLLAQYCHDLVDGAAWQTWVLQALETAGAVAAMFGAAGPGDMPAEPPPSLSHAIQLLEAEAGQ